MASGLLLGKVLFWQTYFTSTAKRFFSFYAFDMHFYRGFWISTTVNSRNGLTSSFHAENDAVKRLFRQKLMQLEGMNTGPVPEVFAWREGQRVFSVTRPHPIRFSTEPFGGDPV